MLGRVVTHHPRQRRIGIEQAAARRRHINSVDGAFEQLAIAFLGQPLFGQGANRGLARGVGIDQRAAEHFGGARDVADLVFTSVAGIDVSFSPTASERIAVGDGLERPNRPAHHEQRREQSDQDSGGAKHDALPFVVGQRAGEDRWTARALVWR